MGSSTATVNPSGSDLLFIKELFEAGKVMPVIDRIFPLYEIPEALRCLKAGHVRGKVVIPAGLNDKTC